jgi:hypothetical protein
MLHRQRAHRPGDLDEIRVEEVHGLSHQEHVGSVDGVLGGGAVMNPTALVVRGETRLHQLLYRQQRSSCLPGGGEQAFGIAHRHLTCRRNCLCLGLGCDTDVT